MDRKKVIKKLQDAEISLRGFANHFPPLREECHEQADACHDALELLKEQQKGKQKSCGNCLMCKLQAVRGTEYYYYRCKKHRIWVKYGFYCSEWKEKERGRNGNSAMSAKNALNGKVGEVNG